MTKRNSVIGIGGITLDRAVSWGQTGDGTQAEGVYDGTAKRMLPCLETEFGISREAETVLPPLLSARLLTDLFRMLLCRNSQTQSSSKGVKTKRFLRLFYLLKSLITTHQRVKACLLEVFVVG